MHKLCSKMITCLLVILLPYWNQVQVMYFHTTMSSNVCMKLSLRYCWIFFRYPLMASNVYVIWISEILEMSSDVLIWIRICGVFEVQVEKPRTPTIPFHFLIFFGFEKSMDRSEAAPLLGQYNSVWKFFFDLLILGNFYFSANFCTMFISDIVKCS